MHFRWRDYAHHNQVKVMARPAEEFLRRFLLHVVPAGFLHIRHFGLVVGCRAEYIQMQRHTEKEAPGRLAVT